MDPVQQAYADYLELRKTHTHQQALAAMDYLHVLTRARLERYIAKMGIK